MHKINTETWKEIPLGELFEIITPQKRYNAKDVFIYDEQLDGMYRYIARTAENNGIRGYLKEEEAYLQPANTISFGQDTSTVFYQNEPYFTSDKIKVFQLKNGNLDEYVAEFFVVVIQISCQNFAWGVTSFNEKVLKNIMLKLPVTSTGVPDYEYMAEYVETVQNKVKHNLDILLG